MWRLHLQTPFFVADAVFCTVRNSFYATILSFSHVANLKSTATVDLFNSVWCRCLFCVCRNAVSVAKSFRIVSNCRYFHVLPCCQNNFNTFCRQSSECLFTTKIQKKVCTNKCSNFLLMLTFSTAFGVVVCFVSVETAFQLPKVSVSSVITNIFHVLPCCQNNFNTFCR